MGNDNPRKSGIPNAYHLMSIAEKRAITTATQREQAMRCPSCETQVMPVDLLPHIDTRCPGPPEPGPRDRWVGHRDALALGTSKATLSFWANKGLVRIRDDAGGRKYLLRDLAGKIAQRRGFRRRGSGF